MPGQHDFCLQKPLFSGHSVLYLGSQIPECSPADYNKDFQLAINRAWVLLSGSLPVTSISKQSTRHSQTVNYFYRCHNHLWWTHEIVFVQEKAASSALSKQKKPACLQRKDPWYCRPNFNPSKGCGFPVALQCCPRRTCVPDVYVYSRCVRIAVKEVPPAGSSVEAGLYQPSRGYRIAFWESPGCVPHTCILRTCC